MGLERISSRPATSYRLHAAATEARRRLRPWLTTALCLLGSVGAARAHAAWADGTPVPDWITKACCGPGDAHRLRPDQVHRVADGYMIDGYPRQIFDAQVLPSPDGEYWAFYGDVRDADGSRLVTSVFCFFAPSWG